MEGSGIQEAVKQACSLTYVSQKLDISRPSLYKYMDLYDRGERERIPQGVLSFLDYMSTGLRSDDDVILYFMGMVGETKIDDGKFTEDVRAVSGGGRMMVMFPDVADPGSVVVEVLVRTPGGCSVIGEYRPGPGKSFVTIDDLVPGHEFLYRVRGPEGYLTGSVPFVIGDS